MNLLIYFNKDWHEEYGRHFEMWNKDMTKCEKKILSIFNRCVIFNTTDFSFHGHPDPLNCPENRTIKSLALYYYSNDRPAYKEADVHTTLFKERPEEYAEKRKNSDFSSIFKTITKKLLPPIIKDLKNS